jgi:hypothetical protein
MTTTIRYQDALDAALWMAGYGYQLWPCRIQLRPNKKGELKKEPSGLPASWTAKGLTDPAEIRARFIAVRATGYIICCGPSGITGVDLDQHGVDGRANWIAHGGSMDAAFMVRTPMSGEHLYYASGGSGNKSSAPLGIDIRGVTGGLFGPGSVVLDVNGQPVGTYHVLSGSPVREQLTLEPITVTASVGASRDPSTHTDADQFFSQLKPIRKSQVVNTANRKVDQVRAMQPGVTDSMKLTIMGAAYTLGGLLHTDLFTYDQAYEQLINACAHVFGKPDDDDERWISYGLDTGKKKPLVVYDDIHPEGVNPLDTPASLPDDRIVDLSPYLDGTYQPPVPNVGAKREHDGIQTIYQSRWNTIVGLTEAGKSLFAVWQSVHVIHDGGLVVYLHFEETDPRGTLERMRSFGLPLGIDTDTIRKQFVWMNCETKWTEGAFAQVLQRLPVAPTLVVLDGINAAVSQHGEEIMHPKSVAQYRTLFVKPATSVGAAVLSLGHPVKDRQRQDERHSFGSTAWLDETDGVALRLVATARPITKGRKGSSSLSVVKDRYGEVKKHGEPNTKKEAGWFFLGSFIVDDSASTDDPEQLWWSGGAAPGTTASLVLPKPKTQGPGPQANGEDGEGPQGGSEGSGDDAAVLAVVAQLAATGKPINKRTIYAHARMAKRRAEDAIERLVHRDELLVTAGPNRAQIFSLPRKAGVPHDQS